MKGNGVLRDMPLEHLGAPAWAIELDSRACARHKGLEERVSALEQASVKGAAQHGARAGRRWGAFLGALMGIAGAIYQIPSCQSRPAAPSIEK